MTKLRILLGVGAVVALGVWVAGSAADVRGNVPICSSPGVQIAPGTYRNLTITGNAYVAKGSTVTVTGNLTLTPGSCLDAFDVGAVVNVSRNVLVGPGAVLALGCTPTSNFAFEPCEGVATSSRVGGSIIAAGAYTMYLDGDVVGGNVISLGGGPGLGGPYTNFPIKDNTIGGDLIVLGWHGAWAGAIRNTVGGNLIFSGNQSVQDPDANEVQTNTVQGNLICVANSPAAHVNPVDGGQPNTVAGHKIGQCAGL